MRMSLSDLKVGDEVGVVRMGSWDLHSEGIYTVKKIDKVKIVVARQLPDNTNRERSFSVKTGLELSDRSQYRKPFLESVADQRLREEHRTQKKKLDTLWSQAESAAHNKDMAALEAAFAALKAAQEEN